MLKMPFPKKRKPPRGLLDQGVPSPEWPARITHLAFILAIVLVGARALMSETLRDLFDLIPGTAAPARSPGPATSLLLDLLCCVPALLVLLRRGLDRQYILRFAPSHAIMGTLGLWTALSVFWASDRFAAMIGAANLLAAFALLWAAVQLVRSWSRLRFVASVCFALLVVYVAAGLNQRLVNHPAQVRDWNDPHSPTSRWQYMKTHGLTDTDFAFRQFESNVLTGSLQLFGHSANTYAAALVLLCAVTFGLIAHRLASRDHAGWIAALLVPLPLAGFCLYHTHSLTAFVTPVIAVIALAKVRIFGTWLARHSRSAFWLAVAVWGLGALALIGHGLYHNSLFIKTLTYRWYYWTGAARLLADHPIAGVGFANFGDYYPSVRQVLATETVKDPHNFVVRFFAELGIIGGTLLVAWMLRMWWELTRPITPPSGAATPLQGNQRGMLFLAIPAVLIAAANLLLGVDLSADRSYVFMEIAYRAIAALLLVAALAGAALGSLKDEKLDERPCPWVLWGILVALGVFLIHNLIDFSLFEPGPMTLFALLAGSALGVRQPSAAGRRRRDRIALAGAVTAVVVWLAAGGFLWAPTAAAEAAADAGNRALREQRLPEAAGHYVEARARQPLNSEYVFRAAQALAAQDARHSHVLGAIELAIQGNRRAVRYHVFKARYELAEPNPDPAIVREGYDAAVRLDPNDIELRVAYAEALRTMKDPQAAAAQFRRALELDAALPPDEPKRLSPARRAQIEQAARGGG